VYVIIYNTTVGKDKKLFKKIYNLSLYEEMEEFIHDIYYVLEDDESKLLSVLRGAIEDVFCENCDRCENCDKVLYDAHHFVTTLMDGRITMDELLDAIDVEDMLDFLSIDDIKNELIRRGVL